MYVIHNALSQDIVYHETDKNASYQNLMVGLLSEEM